MSVVHVDFRSRSVCHVPANYWAPVRTHWERLQEELTWKQFNAVTVSKGLSVGSYRERFERTLKVSKSLKLRNMAEYGLRLCAFAEAADERKQASL